MGPNESRLPREHPAWNSDVWFHLADNSGWVTFAAVRADPTVPDPSGFSPDGGRPALTDESCSPHEAIRTEPDRDSL